MLLVICPNLAVDRILEVDVFRPAAVQRSLSVFTQPGGKGSNVARVFRQLGGDVVLTGFVGRRHPESIIQPLADLGVKVDVIEAYDGESRTCTIIREQHGAHPTVINEESGEVRPEDAEALLSRVKKHLAGADAVLVTGSLSRGLPDDFYESIIKRAVSQCGLVGIDATGAALRNGLKGKPHLLKANASEIGTIIGPPGHEPQALADCLARNDATLPPTAIVTLGESGSILRNAGIAFFARPSRISYTNPIGAGDAFAAGFIKARLERKPAQEALAYATAVAASDASTARPGWIVPEDVASLFAATKVSEVVTPFRE